MNKIQIIDNKFNCPMMGTEISERGDIMYATCAKCKYNKLGQFVDGYVYCGYGDLGEGGGDVSTSTVMAMINDLQEQLDSNKQFDDIQQELIENNSRDISYVSTNIGWETYES